MKKLCIVFAILVASLPTFPMRAEDARDSPEPKTGLVIANDDVLDSKAQQMGGRMITIRKINPLDLPVAPDSVQPPDPFDPGVMERLRLLREKRRATRFVLIGATVYRSSSFTAGPRTKVTLRDPQSGQLITCWSSADFVQLANSTGFTDDAGTIHTLIMAHGTIDIDRWGDFVRRRGGFFQPPVVPFIPPGSADFVVMTGEPSPDALAALDALHNYYNEEKETLAARYHIREQERLAHAAALLADPPRPKDITLNYWRVTPSAPVAQEGGVR